MIEGIASYAATNATTQAVHHGSIQMAVKAKESAEAQGRAAVGLIESAGQVARPSAPAPDGTGRIVNVQA